MQQYEKVHKNNECKDMRSTSFAHHVVDVWEKLLQKVPQSAQVKTGVFLSVWTISLAPCHCFVQPELHLLDIQQRLYCLLKLAQWLQLRHSAACPGKFTWELREILVKTNNKTTVKTKHHTESIVSSAQSVLFSLLSKEHFQSISS